MQDKVHFGLLLTALSYLVWSGAFPTDHLNWLMETFPAIIGGIGTVGGPLLGAFILMPISEYLRVMLGNMIPGGHLIAYAILLIVIIRVKPLGLVDWLNGLKWYRQLSGAKLGVVEAVKK